MRAAAKIISLLVISCAMTGCASTWNPKDPKDPYENYNRKVFAFNLSVDRHVYRPIARGYDAITPKPVQKSVANFFNNVDQVPTIANDLLQLNIPWTFQDVGRLVVNTTLGIGGLFDVAKHMGLERHSQDFGLTLAKWGVRESPYLMVPFFAPSTARDFTASFVDYYGLSIWPYVDPQWLSYSLYGVNLVELRAALLPTDKLIDEAFDPYVFMRDAYLQNREGKIQKVLNPNGTDVAQAASAEDEAAINAAIAEGDQTNATAVAAPVTDEETGATATVTATVKAS